MERFYQSRDVGWEGSTGVFYETTCSARLQLLPRLSVLVEVEEQRLSAVVKGSKGNTKLPPVRLLQKPALFRILLDLPSESRRGGGCGLTRVLRQTSRI